MPTKLSRYCEGLLEAGWLAAVVLTPVFFNIYSARIFEPDKLTMLRTLALVMLAAWAVKLIEEGRVRWEKLDVGESIWRAILRVPLATPAAVLAIVYIIATIFSVTPKASFWGSYQRLQGTYTTLSYIVVFSALLGNLRRRAQLERLITAIVLASLPISLYGILQRYRIDPVPWGGNVSTRIASNLGNSIFVAAYLIMVFPLTLGRIVSAFRNILQNETRLGMEVARATVYVFIAALQLLALYMSGSRGPALGWMAGTYFMFLLLSLIWKKRWLTFTVLATSLVVAGFLLTLNIPNGPLEGLRNSTAFGRFSRLLDSESKTALVRQYIWEGAVELVSPHKPLQFPDGSQDSFNFLRPLIGYGPESMYVAYNPFYVPELGHVERRNASPDRSHNETWDSLVITGIAGLAVYVFLFLSVFYYDLKWIGLIETQKQRILFLSLSLGGGAAGAVGVVLWRGIEYIGVGLPFGVALGLIAYLALAALSGTYRAPETPGEMARTLILAALVSAVLAHYLEINFGIAIAATRTYFWTYAALIVAVGYILPKYGEFGMAAEKTTASTEQSVKEAVKAESKGGRKKAHRGERPARALLSGQTPWMRQAILGAFMATLLMGTLGYDFISNSKRLTSTVTIVWNSFTRLPNRDNVVSYGVLALILTTWLAAAVVWAAEEDKIETIQAWGKTLGAILLYSGGGMLVLWLWHASNLAALARVTPTNQAEVLQQVAQVGGMLTTFYVMVFLLLFAFAIFLPQEWPARRGNTNGVGMIAAPVLLVIALAGAYFSNIRVIQADIAFKMAESFTNTDQWPIATLLYKQALKLAPDEDHYYLFLGRSYLEQAKQATDISGQDQLVQQAETDLKEARRINPLNTDHTANLGRLYSWWAGKASDLTVKQQRAEQASDFYAMAVTLSPQNSTLWGEWAILLLDVLRKPDEAYEKLTHALSLDEEYNWTQGLMGDYFFRTGRTITDTVVKNQRLSQAAGYYNAAARYTAESAAQTKIGYLISLGNVYLEMNNLEQAIAAYSEAITYKPISSDLWRIEETIARLYAQLGDISQALVHANLALQAAPEEQKERVNTLIGQIQALP